MKKASGMRGGFGTLYRAAKEFTRKADVYAYEHRRQKKRSFRSLWIVRLNAALKQRGISYNRFIHALTSAGIELNRKSLSELAVGDPAAFDAVVELARPHLKAPKAAA
jgi:large subunit ribosomal protein L20